MLFASKIVEVVNGHILLEDGARRDISSYEEAVEVASEMMENTNTPWLGVDRGSYTSPRYTAIQFKFKVGDDVSSGFNGDYYPEGKIKKISENFRIVTLENGKRFFRRRLTESWKNKNTWGLVLGVRDERNPSF